ncbi:hypothetical protein ABTY98_05050 [Streptomyces sp. NPDC096040]|uniref:hypothetical protein n=1 Tax=Streptomyces sp. NPDC096040 TaxID=3155541 RepID=UPI00332C8DD2
MSWETVARALQDGDPRQLSDLALAAEHGCSVGLVARVRRDLNLPAYQRGRRPVAPTLEAVFWERSRPVDGGHREWTKQRAASGTPVISWRGQHVTAGRVAFRIAHGREPEGQVRPTCTFPHCVEPKCQADRVMRDGARASLAEVDA